MHVRTLTETDRQLLATSLRAAGIKARIRKLHLGVRVVFEGSMDRVIETINAGGFLYASGKPFDRNSIQGNQAFIRYVRP